MINTISFKFYFINNGEYWLFVDLVILNPTITVIFYGKIQSHNHSLFGSLYKRRVQQ